MRHVKIIKYWLKLFQSENCILAKMYNVLDNQYEDMSNWVTQVRSIHLNNGFADVWLFPNSVNVSTFISIFKIRLKCLVWKFGYR